MATRMLIDARHGEETRVAVVKGNKIEEFDFESAEHKQIKGNIYLAKVTRVEPSLQAAFVDFGGNRHGFLAFSEIHPDYYQIPKEDREALLAEEALAAEEEALLRAEDDDEDAHDGDGRADGGAGFDDGLSHEFDAGVEEIDTSEKDDVTTIEEGHSDDNSGEDGETEDGEHHDENDHHDDEGTHARQRGRRARRQGKNGGKRGDALSSRAKAADEVRARRQALRRRYKIQDVIQRRQVLLVQVVKEERGNKGAALTTYLSLAGRYTVLMPNSSHGGGISRKISSGQDRKRLKQMVSDLKLPKTMGLIIRTAGLTRNKPEIKRDFDYLARLWDEIREKTLASAAPALIHSDSDLIKRAIRDLYNREIEEVIVEGADGHKAAKEFMKLLMPSHARRVKAYSNPVPLFQRYGAEDQLRAMYDPVVQLKSGGYLVINPTEALVSIDINSGRSTKEHGIEATATATNLEAAKEIARQLRLRDMAGLVVIDFIDMEYSSNIRKVERAMKEALKNDRARIQVGRISGFGLMEMSRQRLRTGVLEATTRECPHCDGSGLVRTASSAGLSALRLIEDEAAKGKGSVISLRASTEAAIYLLNAKRADLTEIEDRYHVAVEVIPDGENEGAKMSVSSSGPRPTQAPSFDVIMDEPDEDDDVNETESETEGEARESGAHSDDDGARKKRRRRGGRGRKNRRDSHDEDNGDGAANAASSQAESDEGDAPSLGDADDKGGDAAAEKPRKRANRSRRKSADKAKGADTPPVANAQLTEDAPASDGSSDAEPVTPPATPQSATSGDAEAMPKKRRSRAKKTATPTPQDVTTKADAPTESTETALNADEKPKRRRTRKKAQDGDAATAPAEEAQSASTAPSDNEAKQPEKPKRKSRAKAAATAKPKKADAAETVSEKAPKAEVSVSDAAQSKTESGAHDPDNSEKTAPRRGWWQRTFGE